MEEILLSIGSKEDRYAHVKNKSLSDLFIERKGKREITHNIYCGRVTNILENIQSAFVDIGNEVAFVHTRDLMVYSEGENGEDCLEKKLAQANISELLEKGQPVLVQVVKEALGSKGARLSSNISLAGRYLVLLPHSKRRTVSQKIESHALRNRLKTMIRKFDIPEDIGIICRTSSAQVTPEVLEAEAKELFASWQGIFKKFQESPEPRLLYEDSNIIKRALLKAIDRKCSRILVEGQEAYQSCKDLYTNYHSECELSIELYRDKIPMFERFHIERDIEKALLPKVWLPSGAYLFFEETEGMRTVDVNSGRSTNTSTQLEETLLRINLEAAKEIARQLRIRNIGGLIICDFIDMRFYKNRRLVLNCLRDEMQEDTAKCSVLNMSEFGLVEITRQRERKSLHQIVFTHCPYCIGQGTVKTHESMYIELERAIIRSVQIHRQFALRITCHPQLYDYLVKGDDKELISFAETFNARLEFSADENLHLNDYFLHSTINDQLIEQ